MAILSRLFGKRKTRSDNGQTSTNLAFILLSRPQLPDPQEVVSAFSTFAPNVETLGAEPGENQESTKDQVLSFKLNTGETSFVAIIPTAIPNGEADNGAQFSLSSFRDNWKLPQHVAHLIVTMQDANKSSPVVRLSRFTSLLAAVTKCSPAVGVYWGKAGATHDSDFFVSVAEELEIVPRMMLWSGVSIARERDGRLSLLSLGMSQLNLPDLLLVAGESSESVAIETMYDLLAYVAERGKALPEGDTVGRTANERLPIRYVKSPVDSKKKVWRVVLP